MVIGPGIAAVERGDPAGQLDGDLVPAPLLEHPARLLPGPLLGRLEGIEQRPGVGADQLRPRHRRASPGRDPPDPTAGVVAPRVAEIDLAVLDDRVVPVGDVDRPVRPHLDVDRAEGHVLGLDQLGLLARGEAGAVVADDEPADAIAAEVVGQQASLPGLGHVPAADDLEPAVLRAARIEPRQDADGVHGPHIGAPGDAIVDPLAAGAVGRERLPPAVEVVTPGVDQPPDEDLQPHRLGAELPDSPAAQPAARRTASRYGCGCRPTG